MIEFLGPQIRRFSAQARGDFDFTALAASTREIQTAMTQRDAVGLRAALITLFDRVLPAVIDRAEERGRRVGAEQLDA